MKERRKNKTLGTARNCRSVREKVRETDRLFFIILQRTIIPVGNVMKTGCYVIPTQISLVNLAEYKIFYYLANEIAFYEQWQPKSLRNQRHVVSYAYHFFHELFLSHSLPTFVMDLIDWPTDIRMRISFHRQFFSWE